MVPVYLKIVPIQNSSKRRFVNYLELFVQFHYIGEKVDTPTASPFSCGGVTALGGKLKCRLCLLALRIDAHGFNVLARYFNIKYKVSASFLDELKR